MRYLGRHRWGIGLVTVTVAAVLLGIVAFGGSMFSPGPLKAQGRRNVELGGVHAHAETGGNCAACHAPPWDSGGMTARCLGCHADVRRQLDAGESLHGRLPAGRACRDCHTEHRGADAVLTDLSHFDHGWTAFPLTGQHQGAECSACHTGAHYQGTSRACVSCHAEPRVHKGRFGTDCARCHGTHGWAVDLAAASGLSPGRFDHGRTSFPLTGKHRQVDCRACHVKGVFKGTAQACSSCHTEPTSHKGRFGANCVQCHTTSTWSGAVFAHTFPLNHGRRRQKSDCATCHKVASDFKTYTCFGCHQHEPTRIAQRHKRVRTAELERCAVCHPTGRGHERRGRDRAQRSWPDFTPSDLFAAPRSLAVVGERQVPFAALLERRAALLPRFRLPGEARLVQDLLE
jgi:hypothetical protein